ncbi:Ubiquitin carboxyl-terminal hydrolase 12 [Camellia lanceoleosa]|uniref:Ubiquitin carboxyl-terminal hydrolase 12 n=1 Tax=Camellia lanceoleosa TaxID=1840588 RepID=A0ACC0G095_9ERIC|nr:Ubiquitin carboxyl-terminal hydrolase 12 [Camellia lanceoleosa]
MPGVLHHLLLKVTRSLKDIPPAHYILKIESSSLLSQLLLDVGMKNYESDIFEANGYKWKLSLYPNGDKQRKGKGHISLYLLIAETSNLPVGWEVNVSFKLFVYNHIQDKYLTFQGFPQLLSLGTCNDAANGYLIRDTCMFGAEVVVMNCTGRGECLTLLKKGLDITYTWKIDKFSSLVSKIHYSNVFTIGNQKWYAIKGKCLSLYLELDDLKSFPSEWKTYAKYKLCIRNQIYGQHVEVTGTKCFSASTSVGWGNHSFLSFTEFYDASKGFLVKDTLITKAEVSVLSTVNNFSK